MRSPRILRIIGRSPSRHLSSSDDEEEEVTDSFDKLQSLELPTRATKSTNTNSSSIESEEEMEESEEEESQILSSESEVETSPRKKGRFGFQWTKRLLRIKTNEGLESPTSSFQASFSGSSGLPSPVTPTAFMSSDDEEREGPDSDEEVATIVAVDAAEELGKELEAMGYNLNCESFITKGSSDVEIDERYKAAELQRKTKKKSTKAAKPKKPKEKVKRKVMRLKPVREIQSSDEEASVEYEEEIEETVDDDDASEVEQQDARKSPRTEASSLSAASRPVSLHTNTSSKIMGSNRQKKKTYSKKLKKTPSSPSSGDFSSKSVSKSGSESSESTDSSNGPRRKQRSRRRKTIPPPAMAVTRKSPEKQKLHKKGESRYQKRVAISGSESSDEEEMSVDERPEDRKYSDKSTLVSTKAKESQAPVVIEGMSVLEGQVNEKPKTPKHDDGVPREIEAPIKSPLARTDEKKAETPTAGLQKFFGFALARSKFNKNLEAQFFSKPDPPAHDIPKPSVLPQVNDTKTTMKPKFFGFSKKSSAWNEASHSPTHDVHKPSVLPPENDSKITTRPELCGFNTKGPAWKEASHPPARDVPKPPVLSQVNDTKITMKPQLFDLKSPAWKEASQAVEQHRTGMTRDPMTPKSIMQKIQISPKSWRSTSYRTRENHPKFETVMTEDMGEVGEEEDETMAPGQIEVTVNPNFAKGDLETVTRLDVSPVSSRVRSLLPKRSKSLEETNESRKSMSKASSSSFNLVKLLQHLNDPKAVKLVSALANAQVDQPFEEKKPKKRFLSFFGRKRTQPDAMRVLSQKPVMSLPAQPTQVTGTHIPGTQVPTWMSESITNRNSLDSTNGPAELPDESAQRLTGSLKLYAAPGSHGVRPRKTAPRQEMQRFEAEGKSPYFSQPRFERSHSAPNRIEPRDASTTTTDLIQSSSVADSSKQQHIQTNSVPGSLLFDWFNLDILGNLDWTKSNANPATADRGNNTEGSHNVSNSSNSDLASSSEENPRTQLHHTDSCTFPSNEGMEIERTSIVKPQTYGHPRYNDQMAYPVQPPPSHTSKETHHVSQPRYQPEFEEQEARPRWLGFFSRKRSTLSKAVGARAGTPQSEPSSYYPVEFNDENDLTIGRSSLLTPRSKRLLTPRSQQKPMTNDKSDVNNVAVHQNSSYLQSYRGKSPKQVSSYKSPMHAPPLASNTSDMEDTWAEIANASLVVERAMDRLDTFRSEDTEDPQKLKYLLSAVSDDDTIGDVERALNILKKHATRLGVKETDLLMAVESHDTGLSGAEESDYKSYKSLTIGEELYNAFSNMFAPSQPTPSGKKKKKK